MVSSFAGCILVIQPSFLFNGEGVDPFGALIAVFSAFTLAIAYIVISSSTKYDIDFGSMHFFYAFFSFMYSPVLKVFTQEQIPAYTLAAFMCVCAGLSSNFAGLFETMAYSLEKRTGMLSIISYSQIFMIFVVDWLVFDT